LSNWKIAIDEKKVNPLISRRWMGFASLKIYFLTDQYSFIILYESNGYGRDKK
jgi:hypothetical protein